MTLGLDVYTEINSSLVNMEAQSSSSMEAEASSCTGSISIEPEASSSMGAMEAEDRVSSSVGAMGPLLKKLGKLLAPEIPLPKPLKHEIELLDEDLQEMLGTLMEQPSADPQSPKAKYWMDELRELSYDAEDCIDAAMWRYLDVDAKVRVRSVHSFRVRRLKKKPLMKRRPVAAKIAELRDQVRQAIERHERYQGGDDCCSSSGRVFAAHGRAPSLYGSSTNLLVGVDDLKTRLVEWLTNEAEPQLRVACIVGPAGVGKTTLAKEVYREVAGRFECRAFVQASRKPDIRRLLRGMLSQVRRRHQPSGASTVESLINDLRDHLQAKRYFVVTDDICETRVWRIVREAFPDGNNCSRIIITSETEDGAMGSCEDPYKSIFKMEVLGSSCSTKLFFHRIFGVGFEHTCPSELTDVSYAIIRRCGGLPLAVICVASLLASQPKNAEFWNHVHRCLSLNSSYLTLEEILKQAIDLGYNCLPQYLKTCLLYFCMYPEGHVIWTVDLVKQWIAEGFITVTPGEDTWEIAKSYLRELINRGMIQPVQINDNEDVLSCTMHQNVLDLIMHKSEEEKFVTTMDYSQTITGLPMKARRLSLHFSNVKYATKPADLIVSTARSLAFFGILRCMPSIMKFKLLRVLILEFLGDYGGHTNLDLTRICRLFHLRYLKVSCDIVVELPTKVRGLRYLETLEINASVLAIPIDVVHLPNLLHLLLRDEITLPDGIRHMRSLRALQYFDLGRNSEDNLRGLGELTDLQDLHLICSASLSNEHLKKNLMVLAVSLGKLGNLKSVTLTPSTGGTAFHFDGSSGLYSTPVFLRRLELLPALCIFSKLPKWIKQLQNLCILKIAVRELRPNDIDSLMGLLSLTVLSIQVSTAPVGRIIFKHGALPALKYFKFRCCVLRLSFLPGAMPCLQRLKLRSNIHVGEKYGDMLSGIELLLNLQDIVGRIGITGVDESDKRDMESSFKDAITKHEGHPRLTLQWMDSIGEEHLLLRIIQRLQNTNMPLSHAGYGSALSVPSVLNHEQRNDSCCDIVLYRPCWFTISSDSIAQTVDLLSRAIWFKLCVTVSSWMLPGSLVEVHYIGFISLRSWPLVISADLFHDCQTGWCLVFEDSDGAGTASSDNAVRSQLAPVAFEGSASCSMDTIMKHEGRPRLNLQWMDSIEEEHLPSEEIQLQDERNMPQPLADVTAADFEARAEILYEDFLAAVRSKRMASETQAETSLASRWRPTRTFPPRHRYTPIRDLGQAVKVFVRETKAAMGYRAGKIRKSLHREDVENIGTSSEIMSGENKEKSASKAYSCSIL